MILTTLNLIGALTPFMALYLIHKNMQDHKQYHATIKKIADEYNKSMEVVATYGNYIKQLFFLMDILAENSAAPVRILYAQLRSLEPSKLPKNRKEALLLMRDNALKNFQEGRKVLSENLKSVDDPLEKNRIQENITELDNMSTLLSTVDKDTSDQYAETIFKDMILSIIKLTQKEEES